MHHDYSPQGVQFYYIYKSLAHPETNSYVTPYTLKERLEHIATAKAELRTKVSWICDTMDNDVKHALGDAPNSEFVLDPEGKVVRKRRWSDPEQLRKDLAELVGEVDPPTPVSALEVRRLEPPKQAAKGVVPRVELPGRMSPLVVQPELGDELTPFYVKLRAEADSGLVSRGKGKLYLGFFLDPIYKVHWNNKAGNIAYSVQPSPGAVITPAKGEGPKVEIAADSDPREFLLDVETPERGASLKITVHYIACDDDETFCKPVSQSYTVQLKQDPDGGSRRSFGSRARPDSARRPPGGTPPNADRMRERLLSFDRDRDGKVAIKDLPDRMQQFVARLDENRDGVLDEQELKGLAAMRGRSPRPEAPAASRPRQTLEQRYAQYAENVFKQYDASGDGVLDKSEWSKLKRSPAEADTDGDRRITVKEYLDWLKSRAP